MKLQRKFLVVFIALCLLLSISTSVTCAFAAETTDSSSSVSVAIQPNETIVYQDEDVTVVRVNELDDSTSVASTNDMNYGSVWLDKSSSGSFPVNCDLSGTIGITLKAESSSNDSWAYLSVEKPNGSYFKNNVYVDPTTGDGEGAIFKMYFASSGEYTIHYMAYTSVGMRLMCWLY